MGTYGVGQLIDQEKIHSQCLSDDPKERRHALEQLQYFFFTISDRRQAWNDLHRLISDENSSVRSGAALALGSAFTHVPDEQQAWNDLHKLTNDKNYSVREEAAKAIGVAFPHLPDKQQAWNDLIRINRNQGGYVGSARMISGELYLIKNYAAPALGSAFYQMPDKQQAWNDIYRLLYDGDMGLAASTTSVVGSIFPDVPDKNQAWNDLHRLTIDERSYVRSIAAQVIVSVFSHVPDKQHAWNDLHRLTNDKDTTVRSNIAFYLGSAFPYLPDKQQAWNDLHRLTNDKDSNMRGRAAFSLGSAFPYLPDKQQAWNDLIRIADDQNRYDAVYANHSLGKVSIFKASQAEKEEDYRKELEKAIGFFEKAAKESGRYNPAQFCLPFYRSFHTVIFKKRDENKEVNKYLAEAKDAVKGSKSKEMLLKAVENLANALKEIQSLEKLDLESMKGELNFYRIYCDHAAELMRDTEEIAPYATAAMKKGLPILDRNLKELLEEIQKKAKVTCEELKGTHKAEFACAINREVQKWEISNPEKMALCIEDLAYLLKNKVAKFPEKEQILGKIDLMMTEKDLTKKFQHLIYIIGSLPEGDQVYINANTVITNPKKSKISISGDTHTSGDTTKPFSFFMMSRLILEHPIVATVVGGIIVIIIQKKYFP